LASSVSALQSGARNRFPTQAVCARAEAAGATKRIPVRSRLRLRHGGLCRAKGRKLALLVQSCIAGFIGQLCYQSDFTPRSCRADSKGNPSDFTPRSLVGRRGQMLRGFSFRVSAQLSVLFASQRRVGCTELATGVASLSSVLVERGAAGRRGTHPTAPGV